MMSGLALKWIIVTLVSASGGESMVYFDHLYSGRLSLRDGSYSRSANDFESAIHARYEARVARSIIEAQSRIQISDLERTPLPAAVSNLKEHEPVLHLLVSRLLKEVGQLPPKKQRKSALVMLNLDLTSSPWKLSHDVALPLVLRLLDTVSNSNHSTRSTWPTFRDAQQWLNRADGNLCLSIGDAERLRLLAADEWLRLGEYENAVDGFDEFLRRNPHSPSGAEALLRLGQSRMTLPDVNTYFQRAVDEYPESSAAAMASGFLRPTFRILRGFSWQRREVRYPRIKPLRYLDEPETVDIAAWGRPPR